MCFSASASFTVSAVLLVGGVVAIKKAKATSLLPFASIPILFAIQQFTEGFVWLSLTDADYASFNSSSTHIFLFFAQAFWPAWVSFSIMLLEKNKTRKKILLGITILGTLTGIYLGYCLFTFPVISSVSEYHIYYDLTYKHNSFVFSGVFYFIPTVLPSFVSSVRRMFLFGTTVFASFLFTKIFFEDFVISIWCFFAAIISILIIWIIEGINKPEKTTKIDNR